MTSDKSTDNNYCKNLQVYKASSFSRNDMKNLDIWKMLKDV